MLQKAFLRQLHGLRDRIGGSPSVSPMPSIVGKINCFGSGTFSANAAPPPPTDYTAEGPLAAALSDLWDGARPPQRGRKRGRAQRADDRSQDSEKAP